MRADEIRLTLRNQPFQPFRVHLADGRSFPVNHPELLSVSPDGRHAVIWEKTVPYNIIDVMLVTGLEVFGAPEPEQNKGKNGHG